MSWKKFLTMDFKKLSKLRKPNNVFHLKHLNNSGEIGINTLLTAQKIPSIILLFKVDKYN